jgi:hypothetical protein
VIEIKPGVYKDLSSEDYHGHMNSVSRSGIMLYHESPHKYWKKYIAEDRVIETATPAMELGTALHTFVLEPHLFGEIYVIEPVYHKMPERVLLKNVGRPKFEAYKDEKAKLEFLNMQLEEAFEEKCEGVGKKVLKQKDVDLLKSMYNAIMMHREKNADDGWNMARELIFDAVYEQSYFWIDQGSGLMVKARPDALHESMYVDLKSCASAASQDYQRTMAKESYHVQGAMVIAGVQACEGRRIENVLNVCVESKSPHEVGIKVISREALFRGDELYKKVLLELKQSLENNYFPSYETEEVDLPAWYY